MDTTDHFKSLASTFPYVMVLIARFITGFCFVVICGPLLIDLASGQAYVSAAALIQSGVVDHWQAGSLSITEGLAWLLVAFIAGMFVQQVAGALAALIVLPINALFGTRLFSPWHFFAKGQMERMFRLSSSEKAEWEWQLFQCYVNWGFALNAGVFLLLTYALTDPPWKFALSCWLIFGGGVLLSIMRSNRMSEAHAYIHGVPDGPTGKNGG